MLPRVKLLFIKFIIILNLFTCDNKENVLLYSVSGRVTNIFGDGIKDVAIFYSLSEYTLTDDQGNWIISGLHGENTITPTDTDYTFLPSEFQVSESTEDLFFIAYHTPSENETQVFNWFNNQQLTNGLLESVVNGNFVSLYDNALAAMVFMLNGDFTRAEKIFDFFNARINTELLSGNGGFSQFRDRNGVPNNFRGMGDNAWLLIALNNYKEMTLNSTYDPLASGISNWLIGLQDSDGGLFAGYAEDNSLLAFKVTENNIDAFNAVVGYTSFHSQLLDFLKNYRWNATDNNLVAWPGNAAYLYALDNQSWSYCIFNDYPVSALHSAQRYLTTQTATINNVLINGYDIDEDKDHVFIEGTGGMALAFDMAGLQDQRDYYLSEMEKVLVQSPAFENSSGFPYSSNIGTGYGSDPLWPGADTKIAISGGAWYLFAKYGFNPFAVGRDKTIPEVEMFWLD